jgi:hypothetical protein
MRLISLYGGTVEKFIGDAVMAVWGTPVVQEDDAERAVRAALDLVAMVSALGQELGAPEAHAPHMTQRYFPAAPQNPSCARVRVRRRILCPHALWLFVAGVGTKPLHARRFPSG